MPTPEEYEVYLRQAEGAVRSANQEIGALRDRLAAARRGARLAWETVHRIALQFNLPNCERVADKELTKLREAIEA